MKWYWKQQHVKYYGLCWGFMKTDNESINHAITRAQRHYIFIHFFMGISQVRRNFRSRKCADGILDSDSPLFNLTAIVSKQLLGSVWIPLLLLSNNRKIISFVSKTIYNIHNRKCVGFQKYEASEQKSCTAVAKMVKDVNTCTIEKNL